MVIISANLHEQHWIGSPPVSLRKHPTPKESASKAKDPRKNYASHHLHLVGFPTPHSLTGGAIRAPSEEAVRGHHLQDTKKQQSSEAVGPAVTVHCKIGFTPATLFDFKEAAKALQGFQIQPRLLGCSKDTLIFELPLLLAL